jgi:hypothetical protein
MQEETQALWEGKYQRLHTWRIYEGVGGLDDSCERHESDSQYQTIFQQISNGERTLTDPLEPRHALPVPPHSRRSYIPFCAFPTRTASKPC